jgi:hypothetical protein
MSAAWAAAANFFLVIRSDSLCDRLSGFVTVWKAGSQEVA